MLFGSVFLTVNVTTTEGEDTLLPLCSEGGFDNTENSDSLCDGKPP